MARTRTLTNMMADIRWLADQEGATLRHTDAALTREINQSIQAFREIVSETGFPYYLRAQSGSLSVGATSPYAFATLDISAFAPTAVRIYSVDLTVDGEIFSLDSVEFRERNDFQTSRGPSTSVPVAWSMYDATHIALMPPPNAAYAFTVWYLPQVADLVAGSDTFDAFAGWEEWVYWDVLIKVLHRDNHAEQYQRAAGEREKFEQRMRKGARSLQRSGPAKRLDTRSATRSKRRFSAQRGGW